MSENPAKSSLPPFVTAFVGRAKERLAGMSMLARVALFSGVGLAIVVAAVVLPRAFAESYVPIFTQLEANDSGAIVAKLKELKVPYRLGEGGTSIEVPEKRASEVKLELAGAGLPHGGGVGFESFDKMRLGATDFEQRVQYRRALEGELARTIGNLGAVQSARVHLVLPEKSVFVSKNDPASASIVVKLRPGRTLGAGEVTGIVNLTASSAPGLTPEHITLLSADGAVLHKPRKEAAPGQDTDGEAFSQTQRLEAALEERARAMVDRIVGAEHVDVRVSAELDLSRTERTEDRFDPSRAVLRSEESSVERVGQSESVAGVPGAEANLPQGAAPGAGRADGGAPVQAAAAASNGTVRESHTRNFELDRVTEKRVIGCGTVKRLTVAVVVDGVSNGKGGFEPRSKEELAKIAALVGKAVGLNDARGDAISVESVPFAPSELAANDNAGAKPAGFELSPVVQAFLKTRNGKIAAGVTSAVVVLWLLLAMRRRRVRKAKEAAAAAEIRALEAAKKRDEEELDDATDGEPTRLTAAATAPALPAGPESNVDPREAAQERAARDPATAALVVRAWLGTSEVEERMTGT